MKYLKTPIPYHGGKQSMLDEIIPMIPFHKSYCEPCGGGLAVFFAKAEVNCEMVNDINHNLITFYRVYQTRLPELTNLIICSLLSRAQSEQALRIYKQPGCYSEIEIAWAVWYLANTSFMGDFFGKIKFSKNHERSYKFITNAKELLFNEKVIRRIEKTQIDCRDHLEVIKAMDDMYCFFYVDPPYIGTDMGHYAGYTKIKFAKLLITLSNIKGMFLLSCYPNEIIERACIKYGWKYKKIKKKANASGLHGKPVGHKIEMLVYNYSIIGTLNIFDKKEAFHEP